MSVSPKQTKKRLSQITDSKAWRLSRPLRILLVSFAIVFVLLVIVIGSLINKYLSPVDINDATPIEFIVKDGWGASTVAKYLYEACGEGEEGLISNKAVFKIYCDFMGKSKELRAGKYYLSKNMDIASIIDVLCSGTEIGDTVQVVIPEGKTIEDIVVILKQSGLLIDENEFLALCVTGEEFTSYSFINKVYAKHEEGRRYALEGYLFPDTYDFYINASSKTVIIKLLNRFQMLSEGSEDEPSYETRAQALGMTLDELMALASLIEKEAVLKEDFYRVSAVFHNRLNRGDMRLDSDAPLAYIHRVERTLKYTEEQRKVDSPYNTLLYKGLPIGPICNPGKLAIEAALNPDQGFMDEGYLYFCLKSSSTGEIAYAKTDAEHEQNKNKYKDNW